MGLEAKIEVGGEQPVGEMNNELQIKLEEKQYKVDEINRLERELAEQKAKLTDLENGDGNAETMGTKYQKLGNELVEKSKHKAMVGMNLDGKSDHVQAVMGFLAKYGIVSSAETKKSDLLESVKKHKKKFQGIYTKVDKELRGNVKSGSNVLGGLYKTLREEGDNRLSFKRRIEGTKSAIETAVTLKESYKAQMSSGDEYNKNDDPFAKFKNQEFEIKRLEREYKQLEGNLVKSHDKVGRIKGVIKEKELIHDFLDELIYIADQPEEDNAFAETSDQYLTQMAPLISSLFKDLEGYTVLETGIKEAEHDTKVTMATFLEGELPVGYNPSGSIPPNPLETAKLTIEDRVDKANSIMQQMGTNGENAYDDLLV